MIVAEAERTSLYNPAASRTIGDTPRCRLGWGTLRHVAVTVLVALLAGVPAHAAPEDGKQGASALVRGDTGQAIAHYTSALADQSLPNDRRAMLLNDRAVARARLGQTKEAFDDFNQAVKLFPEYAALYNNRGNLLLALGLAKEALKDFDRALLLAPGYAAAYNNRAGARMKVGETATAIADYTQAVRLLPSGAAPLSGRGLAHLELGRPHAAIRDFSRAVNSDASFGAGYRNRAVAKLAVGHYEEAIEDLSRAVAFDAKNDDIYALRGHAYLVTGNYEAAIKDFSFAIELKPNDAKLYAERGLAHGRNGNREEALADLGFAIEKDPRSATAFAYRAFVYKEAEQADVGMKDIATAQKLAPDAAEVLWAKAEVESALGQKDQAIADLKRALLLDPGLKFAADALERLDGDQTEAEEKVVADLGHAGWKVVIRGQRYFAVHPSYRKLSVPLEMAGEGQPKLLAFEQREAPLKDIAVLTFSGGSVKGTAGDEPTEFAAILNLATKTVIAIEPQKQGAKVSNWTWGEDKVTVASVDGVTDEFVLRNDKRPAVAVAPSPRRRFSSAHDDQMQPQPWEVPWGTPPPRQRRDARPVQRKKPKTLFELLFN